MDREYIKQLLAQGKNVELADYLEGAVTALRGAHDTLLMARSSMTHTRGYAGAKTFLDKWDMEMRRASRAARKSHEF